MFYILFYLIYFIVYIFRISINKEKWRRKDIEVRYSGQIIKSVQK